MEIGNICPTCLSKQGKRIKLHSTDKEYKDTTILYCKNCNFKQTCKEIFESGGLIADKYW